MMIRTIARPLLASAFLARGVEALQRPGARIPTAQRFSDAVAGPLGQPPDAELLVRVNGAVMAGAGALLAMGKLPRMAGVALAVTMVPGAAFGHRFWEESDPQTREAEKQRFYTDLSLLGGAVLAAVDTAGSPGLVWRTRNAARVAGLQTRVAARDASAAVSRKLPT